MKMAPEAVMRAAARTLAVACNYANTQALSEDWARLECHELMEAIGSVPDLLMDWREDTPSLASLRAALDRFPCELYPGAPDLLAFFEMELSVEGGLPQGSVG